MGRVTPGSTGMTMEERERKPVHPEGESGTDGADTGQDGVLDYPSDGTGGADTGQDGVLGSPSDGTGLQPQGRIHVMTCIRMHVITSLFG